MHSVLVGSHDALQSDCSGRRDDRLSIQANRRARVAPRFRSELSGTALKRTASTGSHRASRNWVDIQTVTMAAALDSGKVGSRQLRCSLRRALRRFTIDDFHASTAFSRAGNLQVLVETSYDQDDAAVGQGRFRVPDHRRFRQTGSVELPERRQPKVPDKFLRDRRCDCQLWARIVHLALHMCGQSRPS